MKLDTKSERLFVGDLQRNLCGKDYFQMSKNIAHAVHTANCVIDNDMMYIYIHNMRSPVLDESIWTLSKFGNQRLRSRSTFDNSCER